VPFVVEPSFFSLSFFSGREKSLRMKLSGRSNRGFALSTREPRQRRKMINCSIISAARRVSPVSVLECRRPRGAVVIRISFIKMSQVERNSALYCPPHPSPVSLVLALHKLIIHNLCPRINPSIASCYRGSRTCYPSASRVMPAGWLFMHYRTGQ
jgi:hypothetical protein